MIFTRSDVDTLTWAQVKFVSAGFDGQGSPQHIEKLVCLLVLVSNLGSVRWHPFFDYAQSRGLDQVPSIATVTP